MATQQATSSFSMSRQLHRRLRAALPRHGDRSKLVARMIEMYLDGEIVVTNVALRNTNLAASGVLDARPRTALGWQQP
jgi:hypothetical protein